MLLEFLGIDKRATPENPSVSLSDPASWDQVFGSGYQSASGVSVTHEKALMLSAVWQAVSMISGDIAKLPLNVYKRKGDNREKDRKHPAHILVRRKANREKSAFAFWRRVMVHALLWNNAYIYVSRNGRGDAIELLPLLPDRTAPERVKGQLVYVTETTMPDGSPWLRPLANADVIHIEGITIDGVADCDLVKMARDSWGLAMAQERFEARYFKHGVRAGGILELPPGMSAKARDKVKEGFEKYHEGEDNWFKTVILRDGAKFHQNSFSLQESQMNEAREEQVREVARRYNLPPSRLGLADSQAYNSKSEDNQNYLETTLSPWLSVICAECDLKLLSSEQQKADSHFFEHNTNALLRMNPLQRYQVYALGLRNRILARNECRQFENLNPVEGGDEFDEFPSGGGTKPGGGADKQPPSGEGTEKGNPSAETDLEEAKSAADQTTKRRRLVFRMTDHARTKAKSPTAFLEWVDSGLVSHRRSALESLGDDSLVVEFVRELSRIAESVCGESLPQAVDLLCQQFEEKC